MSGIILIELTVDPDFKVKLEKSRKYIKISHAAAQIAVKLKRSFFICCAK